MLELLRAREFRDRLSRSETPIPVTWHTLTFQDRTKDFFDAPGLSMGMNKQIRQWERELEKIRQNFFHPDQKPFTTAGNSTVQCPSEPNTVEDSDNCPTEPDSTPKFHVCLDIAGFNAEEIKVTTDSRKAMVHALYEEKHGTSNLTKAICCQVDIPKNISADSLHCLMSADGILTLEAPPQTPNNRVRPLHNQGRPLHVSTPMTIDDFSHHSNQQSQIPSNITSVRYDTQQATPPCSTGLMTASDNGFSLMPFTSEGPVIVEERGKIKMKLRIETFYCTPEELNVKTQDRRLVVSASHEEKLDGCTMLRQFLKEYDLPDTVNAHAVTAFIDTDGSLMVEGPLKSEFQLKRGLAVKPRLNSFFMTH